MTEAKLLKETLARLVARALPLSDQARGLGVGGLPQEFLKNWNKLSRGFLLR